MCCVEGPAGGVPQPHKPTLKSPGHPLRERGRFGSFCDDAGFGVKQLIPACGPSDAASGSRRADAMTEQRAKRIPQWLTIDLLVIAVSLAIIGIGIWIAP